MKPLKSAWKRISNIASFKTPWIELVGERWRDEVGNDLEYWRTKAPDSVIIIPELNGQYLLPAAQFRPGVNRATLDFPGGRQARDHAPREMVAIILARELGVMPEHIAKISTINAQPLLINSSTSSQKLHGFHAMLDADMGRSSLLPHTAYDRDGAGLQELLQALDCLQCRALLREDQCKADVELSNTAVTDTQSG